MKHAGEIVTKGHEMSDRARALYDGAIVIDGLNVSNWDSPAVYASLQKGRITAISATLATWEGFPGDHGLRRRLAAPVSGAGRHRPGQEHGGHPASQAVRAHRRHPQLPERLAHRERPGSAGTLSRVGSEGHPAHVPRAESAGKRVLRAPRRRLEQFRRGRGPGDEPPGDPHRPLPRGGPDDAGGHRGFGEARDGHSRQRAGLLRPSQEQAGRGAEAVGGQGWRRGDDPLLQFSAEAVRVHARGLHRRRRRHGAAGGHRSRGGGNRQHPGPAPLLLALHHLPAGDRLPLDLQRHVHGLRKSLLPAQGIGRPARVSQSGGGPVEPGLLGRGHV